jgi:GNAT superfamily N-acetyltransferase
MYRHLKPNYTVRHPTADDIPAIIAVVRDFDIAETGETDIYTPGNILADWEDLEPTTDAWVVIAPDTTLCGYATLTDQTSTGRISADGYVHPSHYGCGIGITLIELMEARAADFLATAPPGTRQVIVNGIIASSAASRALLEKHGYALTRVYFRMHITLGALPPSPAWPPGITVRACDGSPQDIRLAYETIQEGFKDHWDHTPRSFEDWQRWMLGEQFDPTLWFLAQQGDQTIGAILSRMREAGRGWVDQLAVLRPWRKQGLGLALLQHAFAAFYQRDIPRVGLGVDGQSLTGAQRLYERAGMQITMLMGRYEKELRPGTPFLTP